MKFDLSKFKGMSVSSFELRELVGRDSIDAAGRAIPPNGAPAGQFMFATEHKNQLVAAAIIGVNGEPVPSPFNKWIDWNLRTQEFVMSAYNRMNDVTKKEMDDFLAQSFGTPDEVKSQP